MVIELKVSYGTGQSLMAERLPGELDDAIKDNIAAFYAPQKELTADELHGILPMALPMALPLRTVRASHSTQ